MKPAAQSVLILIMSVVHCAAATQVERLRTIYKVQGDGLLVTLYCLPETRETVGQHVLKREGIPDTLDAYLPGFWKGLNDEVKLQILDAVGAQLDDLEGPKAEEIWRRLQEFPLLDSQWSLLRSFSADLADETFLEIAHSDPLLRPAFKAAVNRRLPDFPEEKIVASMSSAECAVFPRTVIVPHLLAATEQQRLQCFSRLFGRLARLKNDEAEQD